MPFGEGHRLILAAPIHHQHLCPSSPSRREGPQQAGQIPRFV